MKQLIAQTAQNLGNFEGIGNIGLEGGTGDAVNGMASLISSFIGLLTLIAAIYFLFSIVSGAISIMSSGAEKGALEEGQKKITVGVIGIVICISAIFLVDLIAWILGIDGILDFSNMINKISPK
jgi:hypothetical protein